MSNNVDAIKKRILTARGEIPADLVLRGASVVNVFSGEVVRKDIAITDGIIVGLGLDDYCGRDEVDFEGEVDCARHD